MKLIQFDQPRWGYYWGNNNEAQRWSWQEQKNAPGLNPKWNITYM